MVHMTAPGTVETTTWIRQAVQLGVYDLFHANALQDPGALAIEAGENWRLVRGELDHCIQLVTPKLTVVSPRHRSSLIAASVPCGEVLEFGETYERRLAACDPAQPRAVADIEDGLLIIYTSGTTGMPKGALISHRAEIARLAVLRLDLGVTREDAFILWPPMFHMGTRWRGGWRCVRT